MGTKTRRSELLTVALVVVAIASATFGFVTGDAHSVTDALILLLMAQLRDGLLRGRGSRDAD